MYFAHITVTMSVKDRLGELKIKGNNNIYNETVEASNDVIFEEDTDDISALFFEIDKIRKLIEDVTENTNICRKLFSDPTFHHAKQLREEVDSRITDSNGKALQICTKLRQFETNVKDSRPNTTKGRIVRLQNAAMRNMYSDALNRHESFLEGYRESKYSLLQEQIRLTNMTITDEECHSLLESNKLSLFVDNVQAETQEARLALRDVEERHKELLKIENSLKEVKDLFVQMSMLISQQQDLLDTVEYYASQATDNVIMGRKELKKGEIFRKKARSKKFAIILCVGIGFVILLLILILT